MRNSCRVPGCRKPKPTESKRSAEDANLLWSTLALAYVQEFFRSVEDRSVKVLADAIHQITL